MLSIIRTYLPYYRNNLKVAAPVMLTSLGVALAGVIDSVMVGHYGTTDLAAVSFANSVFFTCMVFGLGCTMGVTPPVGYAFVQNDMPRIRCLFHSGARFTFLVVLAMVIVLLAILPALPHLGQDEQVIRTAIPYYLLATVSTLPFLFANYFRQFLEGLGNTMVAMMIAIALNLLNIPLNWIFIFGHLGVPAMGATGAGIATLIVRVMQPVCLYVVLRSPKWRTYIRGEKAEGQTVRRLARLGLPIGLQSVMEIFAFTFSVIFIGWLGKEAVAAHQITNNIVDLVFMVSTGIGAATTIRVAHQYGAGRMHDMHMAARASIHLTLVWTAIGATIMIAGHRLLPRAFTDDPEVITLAAQILVLAGLFQFFDGMQVIGGAMLRGISDVRVPMHIAFVSYIAVTLPLGYILMFPVGLGLRGMWVAFIIGLGIASVLLHWRFRKIAPKEQSELPAAPDKSDTLNT